MCSWCMVMMRFSFVRMDEKLVMKMFSSVSVM